MSNTIDTADLTNKQIGKIRKEYWDTFLLLADAWQIKVNWDTIIPPDFHEDEVDIFKKNWNILRTKPYSMALIHSEDSMLKIMDTCWNSLKYVLLLHKYSKNDWMIDMKYIYNLLWFQWVQRMRVKKALTSSYMIQYNPADKEYYVNPAISMKYKQYIRKEVYDLFEKANKSLYNITSI